MAFQTCRTRKFISVIRSFLLLLGFMGAGLAQPVWAENSVADEVQAIGKWSQQYQAVYAQILDIYDFEKLNALILASENIENDKAGFDKQVKLWSEHVDKAVERIENDLQNLPPPPAITFSKDLKNVYAPMYEDLPGIISDTITSALHLKTAFNRIRKGDNSGVTEILLAQQEMAKRMITAENFTITATLVSIPKAHPNYWLLKMMAADNISGLSEVDITILDLLENNTLETRSPFARKMLVENKKSENYLRKGRAKIQPMIKEMNRVKAKTTSQKNLKKAVVAALQEFRPAFDIEEQILDINSDLAQLYLQDLSLEEIGEQEDILASRYWNALQERLEKQRFRTNLIANIQ